MMEHFNPNLLNNHHGAYSNSDWESGSVGQYFEEKSRRSGKILTLFSFGAGAAIVLFAYFIPMPNKLSEVSGVFEPEKKILGEKVEAKSGMSANKPARFISKPALMPAAAPLNKVAAVSALARDRQSGVVLFNQNGYVSRPIASLTKIMSALILLERRLDWATTTAVVADPNLADNHMSAGEIYTLDDLWHSALVGSSNKAILSLVDASGWSREAFAARMNEKAVELGMGDTIFVEPTGLDEKNVSTAGDLALLLDEALKSEEIRDALLMKEYTLYPDGKDEPHHMWNTDWLLLGWVPSTIKEIRGGKTGYIPSAGYNFMMQVRDDLEHDVDVVVLGADEFQARFEEAKKIAEWVFNNYEWK